MRLVTRSDFDGLACAALLEELGIIDEIFYTHPKDMQDNRVTITANDVLVNVPFVDGCGFWFDHHSSEHERMALAGKYRGASEMKASTARVIFDYYTSTRADAGKLERFREMVEAVDKADSGHYTIDDILDPQGWMMLAFIADPRTGLGYHHTFRISNFELMKSLPPMLLSMPIDDILALPDFQERVRLYRAETDLYKEFILEHARVEGDAIIIDLRLSKPIPTGNRFIEYTLFPDQNISVRLVPAKNREYIMFSIGHSTINRTSRVNVGSLTLRYGGGGHRQVGTCQVPASDADWVLKEIIQVINTWE